jgi:DNA modification methylase
MTYTLYDKDCRLMTELPDESVQCVVTSPPYWGLRKYSGNQDLIWGGDSNCKHEWGKEIVRKKGYAGDKSTLAGIQTADITKEANSQGNFCSLCGAWRGAYGLEPTPEMYVRHTIEILREIRRVLRKDGVVFWNIGDSYASGKGTCFNPGGGKGSYSGHGDRKDAGAYPLDRGNISMLQASGLKPKDLCLIPFRVAIAAQEDGWWVRSDIIWSKQNPMPESVKDRPTNSHESSLCSPRARGTTGMLRQ